MTDRLYYTDPYLAEFEAEVVSVEAAPGGARAIVLDRTAFYPTSGGQPNDTGTLGAARITDVIDRDDGVVLHVFDGEPPSGRVAGRIDWDRRFEHMQQHTGQHVLSAAFDRLFQARTVSFHLGTVSSTIDLASEVQPDQIARAEAEANRIVWENRPVSIRFATAEEAASLPLRKEPVRGGRLRLIEVDGFDLSACGGTHVSRSGGIGNISVASSERFRGGTRVEFLCGVRALHGYRALRDRMAEATRLLSVLPSELPAAVDRLLSEGRDLRRHNKELQSTLASFEADALASKAVGEGGRLLVTAALEGWDPGGLKLIASHVVARPGHIAVLFSTPAPAAVVVARSADVTFDANALLRKLTAQFGGKGGGRPELAQGGGLNGNDAALLEFVRVDILTGGPAAA